MKCGEWRKNATHRITIQERSEVIDDFGGQTLTWATQSTVWAAIEPLTGREVYLQEQNQSRVTSKMTIRYQSEIKATKDAGALRVSYDGRIFPVKYVRNLADDMKQEGTQYQQLFVEENGAEND